MPDHGDDPLASPMALDWQPDIGHRSYPPASGAHRAEGLAGPTRRYAFIVLVLVVMTSLPVLAAISAGSSTISDSALPGGATPFIPQPSDGPVVVPLPPSALPPPISRREGDPIAALAPRRDRTEPAGSGRAAGAGDAARISDGGTERGRAQEERRRRALESSRERRRQRPPASPSGDSGCWCDEDGRCRLRTTPPCLPTIPGLPAVPALPGWPTRSVSPGVAPRSADKSRSQKSRSHRGWSQRSRSDKGRSHRSWSAPSRRVTPASAKRKPHATVNRRVKEPRRSTVHRKSRPSSKHHHGRPYRGHR